MLIHSAGIIEILFTLNIENQKYSSTKLIPYGYLRANIKPYKSNL